MPAAVKPTRGPVPTSAHDMPPAIVCVRDRPGQQRVWENVSKTQARLSGNLGAPVRSAQSGSSLQLASRTKSSWMRRRPISMP